MADYGFPAHKQSLIQVVTGPSVD